MLKIDCDNCMGCSLNCRLVPFCFENRFEFQWRGTDRQCMEPHTVFILQLPHKQAPAAEWPPWYLSEKRKREDTLEGQPSETQCFLLLLKTNNLSNWYSRNRHFTTEEKTKQMTNMTWSQKLLCNSVWLKSMLLLHKHFLHQCCHVCHGLYYLNLFHSSRCSERSVPGADICIGSILIHDALRPLIKLFCSLSPC